MLPTEELSVHVYVLIDDLIAAGAIVIPPRPGLIRRAATPNCPPSRWSATC